MGEVVQFVPRSERERLRLIREARAMYDSVFPPVDIANEPSNQALVRHEVATANADGRDELSS